VTYCVRTARSTVLLPPCPTNVGPRESINDKMPLQRPAVHVSPGKVEPNAILQVARILVFDEYIFRRATKKR
jgi:hypothetical protein